MGTLRMLVSDQENAIADFSQLIVSIETVSVASAGGGGLIDLAVAPEDREVDLVQLQGDAAEEIIRAELAVGTYSKVFLRIGEVRGVLADGVTEAEVSVPSGSLQLNKPFEVAPGETTVFVYDITVVSAGPAGGDVKYLISPVIGESGTDQDFNEIESDKSRKPEATGGPSSDDDKGKPTATSTPAPAHTATATATPEPTPSPTATPDALGADFFLDVLEPLDGDISDTQTVTVVGRTRIDAFVSVNDELPDPDENGRFEATVTLEEGPNFIEIVASIDDEQLDIVILVIYIPEG